MINLESFLRLSDDSLRAQATGMTKAASGRRVELCSIISLRSGYCGMDCGFCIQNRNAGFSGQPMLPPGELSARIGLLAQRPIAHIGLVSSGGVLKGADFETLLTALEQTPPALKRKICVSLGKLEKSQMETLANMGIRHLHHNLETSEAYYPKLCTTQTWRQRADTVERALAAGFSVCSGAIFGVGESWRDRWELARALDELGVNNIPLNFLHPQPRTALADRQPLPADEALRVISLFRFMLPKATLRVCGGRPVTFGSRQKDIFAYGANALMTGNFLTTRGESLRQDMHLLAHAGLAPALGP